MHLKELRRVIEEPELQNSVANPMPLLADTADIRETAKPTFPSFVVEKVGISKGTWQPLIETKSARYRRL